MNEPVIRASPVFPVVGKIGKDSQLLGRLTKGFLGAPFFGDVVEHDHHAQDVAGAVPSSMAISVPSRRSRTV
jgi:hypothetical protein